MTSEQLSARRRQTRRTLVDAGAAVFAAKGVDGASIEEISEAAGFTRGAFYSNFSSRDELVLASVEQHMSDTMDRLDTTIGRWKQRFEPASGIGCSVSGENDRHELLTTFIDDTFREKPETVSTIIAEHEIELHCLRVPELSARYQELQAIQFDRLKALVTTALEIVGAKATISLDDLLFILIGVFSQSTLAAAYGKGMNEAVAVDTGLLLTVLMSYLEFPN